MVLKFAEFEIQREEEQPFEKPVDKPYKDNAEVTQFKANSSDAFVADSGLSSEYKRTSSKVEDSKSNNSLSNEFEPAQLLLQNQNQIFYPCWTFLETLGVKSVTVTDGKAAVDVFLEKENKGRPYDVLVLDTHLKGLGGLDLAKKIHNLKPTQRILMVTTTPVEYLPKNVLKSAMIDEEDILTMPFRLSVFNCRLKQLE